MPAGPLCPLLDQRASFAAFRGCPYALWAVGFAVSLEGRILAYSSGPSTQPGAGPQRGKRPRLAGWLCVPWAPAVAE